MRKSPFPGMDPYLEQRWGDVHSALCTGIRAALQPNLPAGLRARAQEDVLLETIDPPRSKYFEPDISIVQATRFDPRDDRTGLGRGATAVIAEPIAIRRLQPEKRNRWVEIIDTTNGNRVVTAIEILSPGNKSSGRLNMDYRRKISSYLEGDVSVVEIDLLRTSRARLVVPEDVIPPDRRAAYYTSVCRATDPSLWLVYPMDLRQPLPNIPIPCRQTDTDVILELQPVIDRIYLEGGHDDIDYKNPAEPPLSPSEMEWAAALLP